MKCSIFRKLSRSAPIMVFSFTYYLELHCAKTFYDGSYFLINKGQIGCKETK